MVGMLQLHAKNIAVEVRPVASVQDHPVLPRSDVGGTERHDLSTAAAASGRECAAAGVPPGPEDAVAFVAALHLPADAHFRRRDQRVLKIDPVFKKEDMFDTKLGNEWNTD